MDKSSKFGCLSSRFESPKHIYSSRLSAVRFDVSSRSPNYDLTVLLIYEDCHRKEFNLRCGRLSRESRALSAFSRCSPQKERPGDSCMLRLPKELSCSTRAEEESREGIHQRINSIFGAETIKGKKGQPVRRQEVSLPFRSGEGLAIFRMFVPSDCNLPEDCTRDESPLLDMRIKGYTLPTSTQKLFVDRPRLDSRISLPVFSPPRSEPCEPRMCRPLVM